MSFISFPTDPNVMNAKQLDHLKANYANLIVDGMDMKTLEQFAVEMIEQNMKDWDEDDVKSEILDYYGEETLMDLMPEQQTKPVNQYLPPRARPQPEDTASLVAMAEAAEPKGFWKWVDSTLDKISGGA